MKVGIDIIEIDRIKDSDDFINMICTDEEKKYIHKFTSKKEHLAGLFCAKEACFKSLNLKSMNFKEIEIYHNENGRPYARLLGTTAKLRNLKSIDLSISHSSTMATAICISDF